MRPSPYGIPLAAAYPAAADPAVSGTGITMSASAAAVAGEHRGDEVGVRGGLRAPPLTLRKLMGVHEVPVVTDGDGGGAVGLEGGLRVLPRGGASCRVPRVADAEIALERCERSLI